MTNTAIENFRSLAPLLLPELIDLNRLEAIDDYDDYALMTFTLAEPMSLENVMDSLEDQMELTILYHMVTSDATDAGQHCCAYSNPSFEHMYKINAQTETDGMAHTLYVYVYDSLEVMMESLKEDMEQHSETGYFKSKLEMSRFIADFM